MQTNNKASFLDVKHVLTKEIGPWFFAYVQKENAAVVTKCLRIQHVPSNWRNCASYSNLRDGCVSLWSEYIRNTKSALHNA